MGAADGYTHDRLCREIELLMKRYPFVVGSSIGKSLVGRELPLLCVGEGERSVLLVGAHHGMEGMTSLLVMRYLAEYCLAVEENRRIAGIDAALLFGRRRVMAVPMLNPDGIELQCRGCDPKNPLTDRLLAMSGGDFGRWQANGRGVDLNHNYNAGFAEYKAQEAALGIRGGGATRYAGEYPESEPETAALCGLIRTTDIAMLTALHTQGEEIYADYNGYYPPGGRVIAGRMAALSGYRVARPEPAACFGGLKDWFILVYDRPGFTVECGLGRNPLPLREAEGIYARIRRLLLASPLMV